MEAAGLPAVRNESEPTLAQARKMAIVHALASGNSKQTVARKLGRGRVKKMREWEKRITHMTYTDREFQDMLALAMRGELLLGLGMATKGLIRRASRGYVPAVKLLFEASGFYNPSVQHQHAGEVVIRLDMPRPTQTLDQPIPDADVVEE